MAKRDMVGAARGILDVLVQGAERAERDRTLPPASVEALDAAGLFGLLVPRELGGAEVDLTELIEVVCELSWADGSAAWSLANAAICAGLAGAYLDEASAAEVFGGRGSARMAGGFTPRNWADPVPGGWRISGRWSFGSGCRHADWIVATAFVRREEQAPAASERGLPEAQVCIVPRDRVAIHDNWQVAGLEGTASCDYSISELKVAADWAFPLAGIEPRRGGALYRLPMISWAAAAQGALALGQAQRALDEIAALARTRQRLGDTETLLRRSSFQQGFGRASTSLRAARLLVFDAFGELSRAVESGLAPSPEQRAQALLAAIHANRTALDITGFAFHSAGAGAVFRSNVLQRCFRDIHTAAQHIVMGDEGLERGGQVLLGLDPHFML